VEYAVELYGTKAPSDQLVVIQPALYGSGRYGSTAAMTLFLGGEGGPTDQSSVVQYAGSWAPERFKDYLPALDAADVLAGIIGSIKNWTGMTVRWSVPILAGVSLDEKETDWVGEPTDKKTSGVLARIKTSYGADGIPFPHDFPKTFSSMSDMHTAIRKLHAPMASGDFSITANWFNTEAQNYGVINTQLVSGLGTGLVLANASFGVLQEYPGNAMFFQLIPTGSEIRTVGAVTVNSHTYNTPTILVAAGSPFGF